MNRFVDVILFGLLFGFSVDGFFQSRGAIRIFWGFEAVFSMFMLVLIIFESRVLEFLRRQNVIRFHQWTVMIKNQSAWVENGPVDALAPVGDLVQCCSCGQQRMLFGNRLFKIVRFVETNLIFERSDGLGAYVAAGTPVMHWSRNQLKKLPRGTVQIIDAD